MSKLARLFDLIGEREVAYVHFEAGLTICGGLELGNDIVLEVLLTLSAADLSRFACACKALRQLCAQMIPGMKLELYRHQRASLAWMRRRETLCHGGILADGESHRQPRHCARPP